MSPSTSVTTLQRFMIFNSDEGSVESSEGDKLLYHWVKEAPNDHKVSLREQIDDICLCDASVTISNKLTCDMSKNNNNLRADLEAGATLSPITENESKPSHKSSYNSFEPSQNGKSLVLTFANTLILVIQVEQKPSIWIAVHVSEVISANTDSSTTTSTNSADIDSQSRPNHTVQYASPESIPTETIERVVNNIYSRFRLLNGSFQMVENRVKLERSRHSKLGSQEQEKDFIRDRVRHICSDYFDVALPQIHLNSIMTNVTSIYNYISYLDLSPLPLMRVNSFINHLISIDASRIRHSIVIFNDKLLWSSLNIYDTRLVYNYLVCVLIRDAVQEELSQEVDRVRRIAESLPLYLTNCSSESVGSDGENSQGIAMQQMFLTVFRSSNDMTLGLFLTEREEDELLSSCEHMLTKDSRFGVIPLASLAKTVGQAFIKSATSSSGPSAGASTSSGNSKYEPLAAGILRRASALPNDPALKNIISPDNKFVVMDRMDNSITYPIKVELLPSINSNAKDHHQLVHLSPGGSSQASKRLRLVKWLIELEPEIERIAAMTDSRVDEFLGKTHNDSWVMVTNSRYRTIYSLNKVKNSCLSDAQQCAVQMKSILFGNRL